MRTPVTYDRLLAEEDRHGLATWLADASELFAVLDFPALPCTGDWWLVRSSDQLIELLASVAWPQLALTIFRQPQLTLRGTAGDQLTRAALDVIPNGQWYAIREIVGRGPYYCRSISDGDTHDTLARDLAAVTGTHVAVGIHPLETSQANQPGWPHLQGEDVFFVSLRRNRNRWPPYDDRPPDPLPAWPAYAGDRPPGF